jgi:hypothetical protein
MFGASFDIYDLSLITDLSMIGCELSLREADSPFLVKLTKWGRNSWEVFVYLLDLSRQEMI